MIFGTDGIRARVGEAPLDHQTIEKLSAVLAEELPPEAPIVVGCDTRASCGDLKNWICSRLGAHPIFDVGIVPTPVVAFETQARGACLGIMITASHNPAADNGLKFFNERGLKLAFDVAMKWSDKVESREDAGPAQPATCREIDAHHYIDFILKHFQPADFEGLSIAFDLAHGAGTYLVPHLLKKLEVKAHICGNQPDGHNINDGVGALHTEQLTQLVEREQLHVGFALDGDGDRLIVTAPHEIHGDLVLYALTQNLVLEGKKPDAIVGTIMCGMGLENTLRDQGIELVRTKVGDQNVLAAMVEQGHVLGGEPSGHLIQSDLFPAGDGFLGALRLARALRKTPSLLQDAAKDVPAYPTYEKAFKVSHKPPLHTLAPLKKAIDSLNETLAQQGRMIIRYSGTEPKLRLYIEASDLAPFQEEIARLELIIGDELS